MEVNEKIEFYFKVLNRIDTYIQLANAKAFTQITILSTLLLALTTFIGWAIDFNEIKAQHQIDFYTWMVVFTYVLALIKFWDWYKACNVVIKPNLSSKKGLQNHINSTSTIFFKDINNFTETAFITKVSRLSKQEALEDLLTQVYVLSHIADQKFFEYSKIEQHIIKIVFLIITLVLFASLKKSGV